MSKRDYQIYAVDFDGTLCANAFPEIGEPNTALINHCKEQARISRPVCKRGDTE